MTFFFADGRFALAGLLTLRPSFRISAPPFERSCDYGDQGDTFALVFAQRPERTMWMIAAAATTVPCASRITSTECNRSSVSLAVINRCASSAHKNKQIIFPAFTFRFVEAAQYVSIEEHLQIGCSRNAARSANFLRHRNANDFFPRSILIKIERIVRRAKDLRDFPA